jgi:hypothetical protein
MSGVAPLADSLGASSGAFEDARGRFGLGYADQAERDQAAPKLAVRQGKFAVQCGIAAHRA